MTKTTDKIIMIDDNYVLTDPSTVFVKDMKDGGKVKAVYASKLKPTDKVFVCDSCKKKAAVQLDGRYASGVFDFTLCKKCLDNFNNKSF